MQEVICLWSTISVKTDLRKLGLVLVERLLGGVDGGVGLVLGLEADGKRGRQRRSRVWILLAISCCAKQAEGGEPTERVDGFEPPMHHPNERQAAAAHPAAQPSHNPAVQTALLPYTRPMPPYRVRHARVPR